MNQIDLTGKTALVCGASQGIGEASAIELANAGAKILLLARNKEKLQQVQQKLKGSGHQVLALDLGDRETLKREIEKHLPIHIVINNSGGPKGGSILEAQEKEFLMGFESHILAAQLLAQICVPGMKKSGYGRIINIISTSAKAPIPNLGVSNTVRGAMANWAKSLSLELGPLNITVNNVLPGYTSTPRLEALRKATAEKLQVPEVQIENSWKASIPMGRFAKPQEIAQAILFLASPLASYVNGINLPVDGGRTPNL
jgi:3-oxoacyl-[acyl-carrier protein] reductase